MSYRTAFAAASIGLLATFGSAFSAPLLIDTIETEADLDTPLVCITFSGALERQARVNFEDYLRIEPKVDLTYDFSGRKLCVKGMVHGRSYDLTIKRGLPGRGGVTLAQDRRTEIQIEDRKPSVSFRPGGYVLPQTGPRQLVVRTVNVREVGVRIIRIPDRGVAAALGGRAFSGNLSPSETDDLANRVGEEVFRGQLSIIEAPNRAVETGLSLDESLASTGPGLFVAVAERKGPRAANTKSAAQWFVVSDLGLVSIAAKDALNVAVRSLSSGRPVTGANLNLIARNNKELGRALTGPDGMARFDQNLLKGVGGNAPAAILANNGDSDFSVMLLDQQPLAISSRTSGRRVGADTYSAYLALSAAQVRPGGQIDAVVILRDDQGRIPSGVPVLVSVTRPDGAEADRASLADLSSGSGHVGFKIPANAPAGDWRVSATIGAKRVGVAEASFQVTDQRPMRIAVKVKAPDAVTLGRDAAIEMEASYLAGGRAQNLNAQAELTIVPTEPFGPGLENMVFGSQAPTLESRRIDLGRTNLDGSGKGRFNFKISASDLPPSTRQVGAVLKVTVIDPDGRAIEQRQNLPLVGAPPVLGLRPLFSNGIVADQAVAAFELSAIDGLAKPVDRSGIGYELVAEETDYRWSEVDGSWTWREISRDRPIASGTLALKAQAPGIITTQPLTQGRYRLQTFDPASGAETVYRFRAGAWSQPTQGMIPDRVDLTIDPSPRKPGETIRIKIKPPFDAQVLVALADRDIRETRNVAIPAEGADIDLKLPDDARGNMQVLVTAYGDPARLKGAQTARAVGLAKITIDDQSRRLGLTLAAQKPTGIDHQRLIAALPDLADGEIATIYLRALPLKADIAPPQPWSPSRQLPELGQSTIQLGDTYDRLIDSRGVTRGQLKSWVEPAPGDAINVPETAIADIRTKPVVEKAPINQPAPQPVPAPIAAPDFQPARFIGPISLSAANGEIPIDLPLGQGDWRVDAIAVAGERIGEATTTLTFEGAIRAKLIVPSRLAPGDEVMVETRLDYTGDAPQVDVTYAITGTDLPAPQAAPFKPVTGNASRLVTTTLLTAPSQRGRIDLTAKIKDTKSAAILDANAGIQIEYPNPPRIQTDASTIAPTRASRPPAAFQNTDPSNNDGEQYLSLYAGAALDWVNLLKSGATGSTLDPLNMAAEIAVHLSASEMNRIPAFDPSDRNRQRALDLIAQLAQAQRADGAFVLGANADETDDYLTTEIIDILNRARDRGLAVPAATLERGFKRLAQITAGADRPLAGRAYALYLLARVRAIELTEAQSFADSYSARLLGPQARAHTAAALMILGDRERARRIYAGSTLGERVIVQRNDAASLKDMAGALALGVEHRILRADEWQPLADAVAAKASKLNTLSASERIAIVLAAPALLHRSGGIVANIDGTAAAETNQPLFRRYKPGTIPPLVVTNLGKTPIQRVDTRLTWPRGIAQASSAISLKRSFFLADGRPADLNRVRRGELLTVVLEGKAEFGGRAQLALTDVTPAGLTIEGAAPSAKAVISAGRAQIDASIGLDEQVRSFRLSYLARASFAGKFQIPAARVVDLQAPEHHANTSDGRMIISAE